MRSIGIVRETYNMWERRVPLVPSQVAKLTKNGIKVFIQPCTKRIFSNVEYQNVGATLQEDLSEANTIFGVKQVQIKSLIPDKTYCFFSHTIKAQSENMPLLDSIIAQNIRLIDYECITSQGANGNGARTVAFGDFAGKAGMIDAIRMTGESFLRNNALTTPFLNIGSAYMFKSYDHAIASIVEAGNEAKRMEYFQENPLVFCFSGNGNVAKGALEVFKHLDPIICRSSDLSNIVDNIKHGKLKQRIIGCHLEKSDLVERVTDKGFEDTEYKMFPEKYTAKFTRNESIAKYCNVLVNGIYWDKRFPRVIDNKTVYNMENLIGIADLSCDIKGSIELLSDSTVIEDPFLKVPLMDKTMYVLGVDILPTELARESSEFFGNQLMPYIESLSTKMEETPIAKLNEDLQVAVITNDKKLTTTYRQIALLREEQERERRINKRSNSIGFSDSVRAMYKLYGHIFDTRAINFILDEVENDRGHVKLIEVSIKHDKQTAALLEIQLDSYETLERLENKLSVVLEGIDNKDESQGIQLVRLDNYYNQGPVQQRVIGNTPQDLNRKRYFSTNVKNRSKHIALFGAGMMSYPLVEYLTRDPRNYLTISANSSDDLSKVAGFLSKKKRTNFETQAVDVASQTEISDAISKSDICISLLPASLHGNLSNICLAQNKDFVTASYVGAELNKDVNEQLKSTGTTFLMELGVDPGIDHMSAKKLIDQLKRRGLEITSFSSVCGGLPKLEPELFKQNLFNYKFSWSPRGVLNALNNDAMYLKNNEVVKIPAANLLQAAVEYPLQTDVEQYSMHCLPNRDSIKYKKLYNLEDCPSVFRGTLRHKGFCENMQYLAENNFLKEDISLSAALEQSNHTILSEPLTRFLNELESYSKNNPSVSAIQGLSDFMALTMAYEINEKDGIYMEHIIHYKDENSIQKSVKSQLILFGDSDYSAMAKTVGLAAAIGCEELLYNKEKISSLAAGGIVLPTHESLYNPVLDKLQKEGVTFSEKWM